MILLLLQEVAPDTNIWLVLFGTVGGAMAAVFGALLAARTTIEKNLKEQIGAGEKRENKAEAHEDLALDRLGKATNIITSLTTAINEFGVILKESVSEIRRNAERSEVATREISDLKREAASLREATLRETGDLKGEIKELRREVSELTKELRTRHERGTL